MGNSAVSDDVLLSELEHLSNNEQQARPCSLKRQMDDRRPDVQEILARLLASQRSTRDIHAALRRAGFQIARDTIADHRAGRCTCKGHL